MGTSTRWPGPTGRDWSKATRLLSRATATIDMSTSSHSGGPIAETATASTSTDGSRPGLTQDDVRRVGEAFLDALRADIAAEPDRFGLLLVSQDGGLRLIATLDKISKTARGEDLLPLAGTPEQRVDLFLVWFVRQVAGGGGTIVDAVGRHAALHCGQVLLDREPRLRTGVESDGQSADGSPIDDDLFCAIYRIFFADLVTDFISSLIASKIQLLVPVLPAIDPTGQIANWVANEIAERVPTPCQEAEGAGTPLVDVARSLVTTTLQRTLGIPTDDAASAA